MPSYVNIGARVGAGTMVDTWATVGSGAQIGRDVHLSGGVGIGGVLEPPGARPVIIEDGAFIGSRGIVVEGVHVEPEAVLGAGVVLTASTAILDVTTPHRHGVPRPRAGPRGGHPRHAPQGVPRPARTASRARSSSATARPSTDRKTSLNQALRDFDVAV